MAGVSLTALETQPPTGPATAFVHSFIHPSLCFSPNGFRTVFFFGRTEGDSNGKNCCSKNFVQDLKAPSRVFSAYFRRIQFPPMNAQKTSWMLRRKFLEIFVAYHMCSPTNVPPPKRPKKVTAFAVVRKNTMFFLVPQKLSSPSYFWVFFSDNSGVSSF